MVDDGHGRVERDSRFLSIGVWPQVSYVEETRLSCEEEEMAK